MFKGTRKLEQVINVCILLTIRHFFPLHNVTHRCVLSSSSVRGGTPTKNATHRIRCQERICAIRGTEENRSSTKERQL